MRIVSDVRSGRRAVTPAAKWPRGATSVLAVLMASGSVAAEDFYLRTGVGFDRAAETRFTDTDCASLSPAALYGCGQGPDGAPRSSLGDFGTRAGLGLGIGYATAFSTRLEVLMEYRPRFAFAGHANFLESTRQQSVSADLSSLSGLLTAYVDLPGLGLPRLGPFNPFIGSGVGVARLEIDDTRMTFPKTTTLVPGARRVNLAWILMTGVATSLSETVTLDLAWRYTDLGDVETGRAKGQVVWRDGSREPLALNLAATRAKLTSHGLQLSLRYAF